MPANFPIRVYYEDTDAGGVVYYANYLKFAERARTECLRELGFDQSKLEVFFVVRHAELDLKAPARLDDLLTVETKVTEIGNASFTMAQKIRNRPHPGPLPEGEGEMLAAVTVKIACVGKDFRPTRIPKGIREKMGRLCKK